MRKWIFSFALLALINCANQENQVVREFNPPYFNDAWPGRILPNDSLKITGMGGFVHDTLFSKSNQVGIGYCVVLPKHYYDQQYADSCFPVIYYLHGFTGYETADVWNAEYYFNQTEAGNFPEVIMVFPNGMNENYIDNYNGKVFIETHIIKELIPFIDSTYRTKANARGLTGFSMGGYGAMRYLLKYPDMFNYAVSIDGSLPTSPGDAEFTNGREAAFGTMDNFKANALDALLDNYLVENSSTQNNLNILILAGNSSGPGGVVRGKKFHSYLEKNGITATYIVDSLEHNAVLFYEKYLNEIIDFEKANLERK